jgi:hypothetical protein
MRMLPAGPRKRCGLSVPYNATMTAAAVSQFLYLLDEAFQGLDWHYIPLNAVVQWLRPQLEPAVVERAVIPRAHRSDRRGAVLAHPPDRPSGGR